MKINITSLTIALRRKCRHLEEIVASASTETTFRANDNNFGIYVFNLYQFH